MIIDTGLKEGVHIRIIYRLLVLVIFALCVCFYFNIDLGKSLGKVLGKNAPFVSNTGDIENINNGQATMPDNVKAAGSGYKSTHDEIIEFIINQKKGRKLVESYLAANSDLKGRSYIADNALSVIALINEKSDEAVNEALDILKNLSSIQNSDGSWYDLYGTSASLMKISGNEYRKADTGNNALLLYAYSYYTNITDDIQFMETMKKLSAFIMSRKDSKTDALYDLDTSSEGVISLRSNTYAYFGLREYSLSCMANDYNEYKNGLFAASKIALWISKNLIDKGVFVKEYSGGVESTAIDMEAQVLGAMLLKATELDSSPNYDAASMETALSRLSKKVGSIDGYKIDDNSKNEGYIWYEGTCIAPIAFVKLGDEEKAGIASDTIMKILDTVQDGEAPRGIPLSTNTDNKVSMPCFECISSSAWAVISLQCILDSETNKTCFGKEEDIFRKTIG